MIITVFTPTYNRAELLPRVFDSLCRQTYKGFEWIIVDDGSTDETEAVCHTLAQKENAFPIRYYKKSNGGKHIAVNDGVKEAKGKLFFILDSDDWLPETALENVVSAYEKIKDDDTFAGVAGLDKFNNGQIVGSSLPYDAIECNAMDIRFKYHVTGDLKEVFKTSVLKEFPFPEIEAEKFCPEQLVWFRIAQKYKLYYFNTPVYVAEYQTTGITAGITRARMKSPIASMMTYSELLGYGIPLLQKIKAAINYWRFRLCSKSKQSIPKISYKWYWAILPGLILHMNDRQLVK